MFKLFYKLLHLVRVGKGGILLRNVDRVLNPGEPPQLPFDHNALLAALRSAGLMEM